MRKALVIVPLFLAGFVAVWLLLPNTVWYRDGRPTRFGKATGRVLATWAARGKPQRRQVMVQVRGRRSGQLQRLPLVIATVDGQRYLVSMLGENSDWVRNVRADDGKATIVSLGEEPVRLEEVPVAERPRILKAYLKAAPGGRPHFPVRHSDPVEAFTPIAGDYPTFRITPR